MKAILNKVVIEMAEREKETDGGIALPECSVKPNTEGTIISAGADVEHVKVGDKVGFPSHLGTRLEHKGKDILVIEEFRLLYVHA